MINIFYDISFSKFLLFSKCMDLHEPVRLFQGLNQGCRIVSWDNEMVLKILISWTVARCCSNLSTFFWVYRPFLANAIFQVSIFGYLTELSRQKMVLNFFNAKLNFLFLRFSVFFCDLITKLEHQKLQSRISSWKKLLSLFLSLSVRVLSFSFSFKCCHSHSCSFLLLPLFSCCYVAYSLIIFNNEF